jgi:glycosyltransferase involved in cell wall biosynthesis
MKVSIVIPVYNEARTLREVLERVRAARLPEGCSREIVVVDDGSTDGTWRTLGEQIRAGLVVGHRSPVNFGKGAALRIGIALASGDIVLIQDGDLECDPNDHARLLAPIVNGDADVVYGSRLLAGRQGMPFTRWIANRALTFAANVLYGARLTDEATAYKAFRASVLRRLELKCIRFEFCPEVTAKIRRLGYRIHEEPIGYRGRGIAEGKKIRARDGVEAMWTLIRYRLASRRTLARREALASDPLEGALLVCPDVAHGQNA